MDGYRNKLIWKGGRMTYADDPDEERVCWHGLRGYDIYPALGQGYWKARGDPVIVYRCSRCGADAPRYKNGYPDFPDRCPTCKSRMDRRVW